MKMLGLLRHAKSSWDDPSLDDFDRPLNDRGRKAAKRMGEELRALGVEYDAAIVSTARRAAATFDRFERAWGSGLAAHREPRLYMASPEQVLGVIAGAPDSIGRLLVVGHNPGIHALAVRLAAHGKGNESKLLAQKFPTGALAEIELPIGRWSDVGEARGKLLRFLRPRDLA
jgi:phosphohistidine phosphatase